MKRTLLTIILTMLATVILGGLVFQRWQRRIEEQMWQDASRCLRARAEALSRDGGAQP